MANSIEALKANYESTLQTLSSDQQKNITEYVDVLLEKIRHPETAAGIFSARTKRDRNRIHNPVSKNNGNWGLP